MEFHHNLTNRQCAGSIREATIGSIESPEHWPDHQNGPQSWDSTCNIPHIQDSLTVKHSQSLSTSMTDGFLSDFTYDLNPVPDFASHGLLSSPPASRYNQQKGDDGQAWMAAQKEEASFAPLPTKEVAICRGQGDNPNYATKIDQPIDASMPSWQHVNPASLIPSVIVSTYSTESEQLRPAMCDSPLEVVSAGGMGDNPYILR
jgi:hypothetical protein